MRTTSIVSQSPERFPFDPAMDCQPSHWLTGERRISRPLFLALSLVVTVALISTQGCRRSARCHVTGRVTLDGQPVADALISFMPLDPGGVSAVGQTDDDGTYDVQKSSDGTSLLRGRYAVRISTFLEGNTDVDPPIKARPERIPAEYNVSSQLIVDLKPGANTCDFPLSTRR